MAIPRVNLNIDPRGYAGSASPDLVTPDVYGGMGQSPIYNLLAQQAQLRNRMAEEQLKMMQLQRHGARQDFKGMHQMGVPQQPGLRSRSKEKARQRMQSAGAARALAQGQFGGRTYRPGNAVNALGEWLNYIGPDAAHAGLMQSGRLLGSRAATGGRYGYGGGGMAPEPSGPTYRWGGSTAEIPWQGTGINSGVVEAAKKYGGRGKGTVSVMGDGLTSREKGGTVPKTGPYKLHKGEVVLSADQVDEPLLQFLMGDKLNKLRMGQMDGKGTGPGKSYEAGTLGSYQEGTGDESAIAEALRRLREQFFVESTPREAGERFRESLPDVGGALGSIGEFFGGAVGTEPDLTPQEIAARGAKIPEPEPIPRGPAPDLSGILDPSGAAINEQTMARAAAGDLGSPDDPLSIVRSGELKAPNSAAIYDTPYDPTKSEEDQEFNPSSKAWRDAEHRRFMAATNRSKAEKIFDYLSANAGDMDPKQVAMLSQQAQTYYKLADDHDKRVEKRQSVVEKKKEAYQKLWMDYQKAAMKIEADDNKLAREEKRWLIEKLFEAKLKLEQELATGDMDDDDKRSTAKFLADKEAQLNPDVESADQYYNYLAEEHDFRP